MDLNGRLISTDQLLYHDELKSKFQQMQSSLAPLLDIEPEVSILIVMNCGLQLVFERVDLLSSWLAYNNKHCNKLNNKINVALSHCVPE